MAGPNQTESDEQPAELVDGAECAADIDAWLKQRAAIPEPDWGLVLSQMRAALQKLCASPLVRNDDQAAKIILRMISAQGMEELATDVDLLAQRITEITGVRAGRAIKLPVLNVTSFDQRAAARQNNDRDADERSSRMVLRL